MKRLEQLLQSLRDVHSRLDDLLAQDSLSDTERAEHDALVAQGEKLTEEIEKEQAHLRREDARLRAEAATNDLKCMADERAKLESDKKALAEERSRRAAAHSTRISAADLPSVRDVPGLQAEDRIPATVKRFNSVKNFKGTRNGQSAEYRAFRFGQWAMARLAQDLPARYGQQFRSATEWVGRHISGMQATAVNTADGSGYQFLIPEEFGMDLIDLREVYGVARRLFKIVPMAGDTRTDPRRQSGLTASFLQEGAAGTESSKQWNDVRLTAKDLMVLSRYTNQLRADAVINVGDDLAGEIAYAFANKEDQCAFNGDATSTYGGIVGILQKLKNIDGAATASSGLVTQATSNTWDTMVLRDFNTTLGKLPQYADTGDVVWVCSRAFYYTCMQRLEMAAGGNTIMELASGDRRPRPLFLGVPVEFSQVFPVVTATTGIMVILGNLAMGASFGDRQQDSIAFSEHATIGGENVFERNQIAIRGTERFDINVHDVGDATNPGPIVGLRTG